MLREEFYEARAHLRKRNGKIKRILVFYGGSDMTNETLKALNALCTHHEKHPGATVDVIVGASNPYKEEISTFAIHWQPKNG